MSGLRTWSSASRWVLGLGVVGAALFASGGPTAAGGQQTGGPVVTSCQLDLSAPPDPVAFASDCEVYIVVLHDSVERPAAVAAEHAATYGGSIRHVYRAALTGYAAAIPSSRVDELRRDPRVDFVEANQKVEAFDQVPATGVDRVFATDNANLGLDGDDDRRIDVDIAILDSGIDFDHPDLNVVGRTNCSGGNPMIRKATCIDGSGDDGNGHGTHVAGIAAALDNDIGVVGVAPGARLWAVKVLDDSGAGTTAGVIAGIDWVTAHADTIEVANMSLGCSCSSRAEERALANSVAKGIVYAVAAGNAGGDASEFLPANHPDVIAVSALADFDGKPGAQGTATCRDDEDDTLANFSNFGTAVDVAAPGVCIRSTWKGGGYLTISGTSMSSPYVAGAAALLISPGAKPTSKEGTVAIRETIMSSGNPDWNDDSGDGIHEPLLDLGAPTVFAPATVTGPFNAPPIARLRVTECARLVCKFDGSASRERDGSVTKYRWSFGDRGSAVGENASYTFKSAGVYTVTLNVTDDQGATGSRSQTLSVGEPLASPRCGGSADSKCETWIRVYDNPNGHGEYAVGYDVGYAMALSPNGERAYVTGLSWDNTTESTDAVTVAYETSTGRPIWTAQYDAPKGLDDFGVAVTVSPDGSRVYVAGSQDWDLAARGVDLDREWVTLAYDAETGEKLWSENAQVTGAHNAGAAGIVVSPDGNRVFVFGMTCDVVDGTSDIDSCDYAIVAQDAANGATAWESRYDGPAGYDATFGSDDIAIAPSGDRLYVTGVSQGTGEGLVDPRFDKDLATVAYDTATGGQLWVARYTSGDSHSQEQIGSLTTSPDGSLVYLTGSAQFASGFDIVTLAYDSAAGSEVWRARYDGARLDYGRDIVVDGQGGRVYVVGESTEVGLGDTVTVAYDAASGRQNWAAQYQGSGGDTDEAGLAAGVSPDGSKLYVGGISSTGVKRTYDFATVAYEAASGTQTWVARYNGSTKETDRANLRDILVSGDGGRVYAFGTLSRPDNPINFSKYGTMAYETG